MPTMEAPSHLVSPKIDEHLKIESITRNSTWIPINPARLRSGAWASLAKVFGEDKAHPIPLQVPNPTLSCFTLIASEIDISVAAKLSVGGIFSGSMKYGDRAFYLDAAKFIDEYKETPGNPVVGTRWGVGLRVLLHVSDIKVGVNLDFHIVGAAVDLGYAKALYEIDGFGIEGGMEVVLGELHGFGNLSAETYFKINDMVIPKLAQYMHDNPSKLIPVPFQVQLIQPIDIDPILSGRSILFAMRRLKDGDSLNQALTHAAGKYDRDEIKVVYTKLAPSPNPDEKPPQSARQAADEWLDVD